MTVAMSIRRRVAFTPATKKRFLEVVARADRKEIEFMLPKLDEIANRIERLHERWIVEEEDGPLMGFLGARRTGDTIYVLGLATRAARTRPVLMTRVARDYATRPRGRFRVRVEVRPELPNYVQFARMLGFTQIVDGITPGLLCLEVPRVDG